MTCPNCDGSGSVLTCCDDICRGMGQCIHGDGESVCPTCHGEGSIDPCENCEDQDCDACCDSNFTQEVTPMLDPRDPTVPVTLTPDAERITARVEGWMRDTRDRAERGQLKYPPWHTATTGRNAGMELREELMDALWYASAMEDQIAHLQAECERMRGESSREHLARECDDLRRALVDTIARLEAERVRVEDLEIERDDLKRDNARMRVAGNELAARLDDATAARERAERERDDVVLCNDAMREPMMALRAAMNMPAQGEGAVIADTIATLATLRAELRRARRREAVIALGIAPIPTGEGWLLEYGSAEPDALAAIDAWALNGDGSDCQDDALAALDAAWDALHAAGLVEDEA